MIDAFKAWYLRRQRKEHLFHYAVDSTMGRFAGAIAAYNADEVSGQLVKKYPGCKLMRLSIGPCLTDMQDPDATLRTYNTVPKWGKLLRSRSSGD